MALDRPGARCAAGGGERPSCPGAAPGGQKNPPEQGAHSALLTEVALLAGAALLRFNHRDPDSRPRGWRFPCGDQELPTVSSVRGGFPGISCQLISDLGRKKEVVSEHHHGRGRGGGQPGALPRVLGSPEFMHPSGTTVHQMRCLINEYLSGVFCRPWAIFLRRFLPFCQNGKALFSVNYVHFSFQWKEVIGGWFPAGRGRGDCGHKPPPSAPCSLKYTSFPKCPST